MKAKLFTIIVFCLAASGCAQVGMQPAVTPAPATTLPTAMLPNPASVYCEQQGNTLEIRTAKDGSQSGVCIFPDGSECEEWAFYRGECMAAASPEPPANPDVDSQGWKIYTNPTLGYSFHYPPEATLTANDEPSHSLTLAGEGMGSESWTISHPDDRAEYLPAVDTDLSQWLSDHYLSGENRQSDLQIGGVTAIHYRHERSPQSFAVDRYYFAHAGQLYLILIGHTGDSEDWELNNQFLDSFEFTASSGSMTHSNIIPTAFPIDLADYQGFWTYTHLRDGFSIRLPEDWVVDETTTFDPVMNGHTLILHPQPPMNGGLMIRIAFRHPGEEFPLWPTGVGQGEFVSQGEIDVAGQPVRRVYLVCPDGKINSIWYQGGENSSKIQVKNMEFSFIFSYSESHCQGDLNLGGKVQLVGEMIIASLQMP